MSADAASRLATADDLRRHGNRGAFEIIGGQIVEKAAPSPDHGTVQSGVVMEVGPPFSRRGGAGTPGGWWLMTEVEVAISEHDILRPDIVGWRRDRVPERPRDWPVIERPDWVCEVLSPTTARRDLGQKQRLYHGFGVPWLWYADPAVQLVQILRWTSEGYLIATTAEPGEVLELPPFEGAELTVARFFGLDPEPQEI